MNAKDLYQRLISSRIARAADLSGCTAQEIEELEKRYGCLNADYKQILSVIGHRAGRLVDVGEFSIYVDQLIECNEYVRSMMAEITQDCLAEGCEDEIPPMPPNYFVILARYGGDYPHFILTDTEDPTVYVLTDDEEVIQSDANVWDFIMRFVEYAERQIAAGYPARPGRFASLKSRILFQLGIRKQS